VLSARPASLFVFTPILDGDFIRERPVEALKSGNFARVPVLFGSNSDEGSRWSATLTDPSANTSMPNATENTVFNFLRGQYPTLGHASFNDAVDLYPLKDYANSFSLQGQQMYGECRYMCTAPMITGAEISKSNPKVFQYQWASLSIDRKPDSLRYYQATITPTSSQPTERSCGHFSAHRRMQMPKIWLSSKQWGSIGHHSSRLANHLPGMALRGRCILSYSCHLRNIDQTLVSL